LQEKIAEPAVTATLAKAFVANFTGELRVNQKRYKIFQFSNKVAKKLDNILSFGENFEKMISRQYVHK